MNQEQLYKLAQSIEESFGNKRDSLKLFNTTSDKRLSLQKLNELCDTYEIIEDAFRLGKQAKKAFVDSKATEAISNGDSRVLIETMKQDKATDNLLKERVAVELYKKSDSFADYAKSFLNIFGGNEAGARRLVDSCLKKYSVPTIKERKKQEIEQFENSLTAKLGKGEITEKDLLIEMLKQATSIAEQGSESNKVMAIRSITQLHERLTVVKEAEAKAGEPELSNADMVDLIDAIVLDSNINKVREIKALKQGQAPAFIEVNNDE